MRTTEKWFANNILPRQKFMAAANIVSGIYHIPLKSIIEILIIQEDEIINNNGLRLVTNLDISKERVLEIQSVFTEIYDDTQQCLDFLNGLITKRYFVRNQIVQKATKNKTQYQVNKAINESLNNVFEILNS